MFNRLPPKVMDSATIIMMLSTTGRILQQGGCAGQNENEKGKPDSVAAGFWKQRTLQVVE